MTLFIICFGFMLIAMLAMAIGLLFGKQGVKGTCHSLGIMATGEHACKHCGNCKQNKRART